ncbi:MAG: hypothetical protein Fur0010_28100 [Bdellovibrio sp.]
MSSQYAGDGKMREGATINVKAFSIANNERKLIAQTTIKKPSFPQLFLLGPKQTVVPGLPFEGPFQLEISFKEGDLEVTGKTDQKEIHNGDRKNIFYLDIK